MAKCGIVEQKVILCGEYGVGKSSLFRRFATDTFITESGRNVTLGLDHFQRVFTIGSNNVKLQLWDTGGMERVASVTSNYYKYAEAAILVFSSDNPASFHVLSQHLLEIVTYAENAKIFLCRNKSDLENSSSSMVTDSDMESFCEQCHNLISSTYKTSCKSGAGVVEMFTDIATQLLDANKSKFELQNIDHQSFKISSADELTEPSCLC